MKLSEIITVTGLTKVYDGHKAIDGLNLIVNRGEIFGFLGPNGAGKSTTIRVMATLTKPTSGHVSVNGFDVIKEPLKVKKNIGVIQQHSTLDVDLSLKENLDFRGRLHRLGPKVRKKRITELLDYVELSDYANQLVTKLSGGMKRKASIACGLMHEPEILFLDEPTAGLDAQSRRRLWDLIRRLKMDGTTVFLTTHYIEEAEALCDRIGILHHGHLIALGSPIDLCGKLGLYCLESVVNMKTCYEYFASRDSALAYAQSLQNDVKTVLRDISLEDVFIELTGQKVDDN